MIRKRKRDAQLRKREADVTALPLDEKKALLAAETGGDIPEKEPDDPLSKTGRLFGGKSGKRLL